MILKQSRVVHYKTFQLFSTTYFALARTARNVVHMLKLRCQYTSLDNLNMWTDPASLYSKVRAIFARQPVHLYGEKFFFSITAGYVIHMLKLQEHYASFDKFYNLNVCMDCSGIALFKS